nr:hypothetical protein BaRGS_001739 [Batillaria attramentaria]
MARVRARLAVILGVSYQTRRWVTILSRVFTTPLVRLTGRYVWKRQEWTHSAECTTAGFVALVSSEVSAITICIITLDRLLVLQFPLKYHLHLTWRCALVACSAAWLTGIVLSVVPLLPATGWEFYSQTGICLPLPITRLQFPGKQYAFGVFIVLNFVLFLLIGTPIPGEVTVLAAIFVLPINSAINPFLYTLNLLLERRRKQREETRLQRTLDRLKLDMITWPMEKVDEYRQYVDRIF